ncbi:MAG: VWA domain-containing protein [Planctomycetota bacterium]|nr:VWA domain-containing protein [Planctomycetota bacterium]
MNRRRVLVRSLFTVIVSSLLIAAILAGCAAESVQMKGKPSGSSAGGGGGGVGYYTNNSTTGVPGATASAPKEELWIVPRDGAVVSRDPLAARDERIKLANSEAEYLRQMKQAKVDEQPIPGSGALMTRLPDTQTSVPIPLKHTDVKASIAGYIATVDVTQQYHNPYSGKIEAVYVFPLPANAAVNEFLMTIGERKIRGIIRERAQAEQIYKAARAQGHVASLMTQERPNVFTQSVANIEPGKQIDVNVKYFHTLEYVDGWYEYVYPMVVGPRFNPPGSTDGIGARARGQAYGSAVGFDKQRAQISYLRPNERSGHDISLTLDIDAGVTVEKLESRNHKVKIAKRDGNVATVKLDDADKIPNKDFVLRYKVAGDRVKSAVMAQRDAKSGGGHFTLMLFPPDTLKDLPRKPLEMVFTLDVSGSMSGAPIEQSKAAIRYALNHMRPDDTFNVVRFAGASEQMAPDAVPATRDNVSAGLQYIQSMQAGGGTMMIEGIRRSLAVSPSTERLRFVAFLTDGYIGNEPEILREIHQLRQSTRIFSFGVGSSPNRYLLDHMAKFGAGSAAYLGLNDNADQVMADYFQRIAHPALTNLEVDWGGMNVTEVYPQKLPDLFVGRPVILTGKFDGRGDATVKVRGKVGGEQREIVLPVNLEEPSANHAGIKSVWARGKIADLFDRTTYESNPDLPAEVKQVALEHGLMSAYTAFVAVDSSMKTAGDHGTSVAVPVPVPEGVRYETTVPE